MRKEVVLAIVSGGVLGALVAFGIWRANSTQRNGNKEAAVATGTVANETEPPTSTNSTRLTIASPITDIVYTESIVDVAGLTQPGSIVVISGEESDSLTRSSETGAFEATVELVGGLNEIKIFAFDAEKKIDEKKIFAVYSTEFSRYILTPEELEAAESTDDKEESIRKKVQEKLNQKLSQPKAYFGSITDISESSIQIKSLEGEIKLISVTGDSTTYVKTTGKTPQNVSFSDLAIGDFVVAMGFIGDTNVLDVKRLLITPIHEPTNRNAVISTLTGVTTNTMTLGQDLTVNLDARTSYYSAIQELTEITKKTLVVGNRVIVSGPVDNSKYKARLVVVTTQQSPTPETTKETNTL